MAQHRMPLRKHTLSAPVRWTDEQFNTVVVQADKKLHELRRLEREMEKRSYSVGARQAMLESAYRLRDEYETMLTELKDQREIRGVRPPAPTPPPIKAEDTKPAVPSSAPPSPSFLRAAVDKLNDISDRTLGLTEDDVSDSFIRQRLEEDVNAHAMANGLAHLPEYRALSRDEVAGEIASDIASGVGRAASAVASVLPSGEQLSSAGAEAARRAADLSGALYSTLVPSRAAMSEAGAAAARRAAGLLPSASAVRNSAQRVADTGRRIAGHVRSKSETAVAAEADRASQASTKYERLREDQARRFADKERVQQAEITRMRNEQVRREKEQEEKAMLDAAMQMGKLAQATVEKQADDEVQKARRRMQKHKDEMQALEDEARKEAQQHKDEMRALDEKEAREREELAKKERETDEKRRRALEELHALERAKAEKERVQMEAIARMREEQARREKEEEEAEMARLSVARPRPPTPPSASLPVHLNYLPPPPEEPPAPAILLPTPFHLRPQSTPTLLQDEPNTPPVNRGKREKKSGALAQFSDKQQRQLHAADVAKRAGEEDEKRRKAEEVIQIERQRAEEARERAAHEEAEAAKREREAIIAQQDYAKIREGEGEQEPVPTEPAANPLQKYDQRRRVNIVRVRIPIEQEELVHVKPEPPAPSFPPESPPQMSTASAPPPSPPPTVHVTHHESPPSPPPSSHIEEEPMTMVPPESPPTHTTPIITEPAAAPTHKRKNSTPHASIKPQSPLPAPSTAAVATQGPAPRAAKRSRVSSKRTAPAAGDRNASSASRYHKVDWKAKEKEYAEHIDRLAKQLHEARKQMESPSPEVVRRVVAAPPPQKTIVPAAAIAAPSASYSHTVFVPQRHMQQWSDMPEDPADMHPKVVTTTTTTTY